MTDHHATLAVNLKHFLSKQHCADTSRYDQFLQYLSHLFTTKEGRKCFLQENGLEIVNTTILQSSDLYKLTTVIKMFGLCMSDEEWYKKADPTILKKLILGLQKSVFHENVEETSILKIAILECLKCIIQHKSGRTWFEEFALNVIFESLLEPSAYVRKAGMELFVQYAEFMNSKMWERVEKELQEMYQKNREMFLECLVFLVRQKQMWETVRKFLLVEKYCVECVNDHSLVNKAMEILVHLTQMEDGLTLLGKNGLEKYNSILLELLCSQNCNLLQLSLGCFANTNVLIWSSSNHFLNDVIKDLFELWKSLVKLKAKNFEKTIAGIIKSPPKRAAMMIQLTKALSVLLNENTAHLFNEHLLTLIEKTVSEFELTNKRLVITTIELLQKYISTGEGYKHICSTPNRKSIISLLFKLCKSNNSNLFSLTASVLAKLIINQKEEFEQFTKLLQQMLFDISWEIRDSCLQFIKYAAEQNESLLKELSTIQLIPTVAGKLKDSENYVRLSALQAIEALANKKMLAPGDVLLNIIQCLNNSEFFVQKKIFSMIADWIHQERLTIEECLKFKEQFKVEITQSYNQCEFELFSYIVDFLHAIVLKAADSVDAILSLSGDLILLEILENTSLSSLKTKVFDILKLTENKKTSKNGEAFFIKVANCLNQKNEAKTQETSVIDFFAFTEEDEIDCDR